MDRRSYFNPTFCPLVAKDLGSVERELRKKSIWELDSVISEIMFILSPAEKIQYKLSDDHARKMGVNFFHS